MEKLMELFLTKPGYIKSSTRMLSMTTGLSQKEILDFKKTKIYSILSKQYRNRH